MKQLNKISDFFITSDTHFGRNNILDIANRKFKNIDKMNDVFIKKWNNIVKKDDIILHLGGFGWDPDTIDKVIPQLNGNIGLLPSYEDVKMTKIFNKFDNITLIQNQILILSNHDCILSHYPLYDWPGKSTGTIHIHGNNVFDHVTNLNVENRVNACVDFWNYAPFQLSLIKEFIEDVEKISK